MKLMMTDFYIYLFIEIAFKFSVNGAFTIPFSVIIAVTFSCGVTSNAGLYTLLSFGAEYCPKRLITSEASLSSMGISFPVGVFKSIVGVARCYIKRNVVVFR